MIPDDLVLAGLQGLQGLHLQVQCGEGAAGGEDGLQLLEERGAGVGVAQQKGKLVVGAVGKADVLGVGVALADVETDGLAGGDFDGEAVDCGVDSVGLVSFEVEAAEVGLALSSVQPGRAACSMTTVRASGAALWTTYSISLTSSEVWVRMPLLMEMWSMWLVPLALSVETRTA